MGFGTCAQGRGAYYGVRRVLRRPRLRADALSRADVQRGPGGVRVAQSEPAAALEEARRRQCRLRRVNRRGGGFKPLETQELEQR